MTRWYIKQDRFPSKYSDEQDSWTLTTDPEYSGWETDSGFNGYGLPKALAEWMCDILNNHGEKCPFKRKEGIWVKDD